MTATPTTLYRLRTGDGSLLYIGIAGNPGRRFDQHAGTKPWWGRVATIDLEHHPSRAAAIEAERAAIAAERPLFNIQHGDVDEPHTAALCPACLAPSVYVPTLDLFIHLDGSCTRRCHLRLVRGEIYELDNPDAYTCSFDRSRFQPCPACSRSAVWVPYLSATVHQDGSANANCWAAAA